MTDIRKKHAVFSSEADVWTIHTNDNTVLGLVRKQEEEKLVALFNFSEIEKEIWIEELNERFCDLITGKRNIGKTVRLEPFGMCWMLKS